MIRYVVAATSLILLTACGSKPAPAPDTSFVQQSATSNPATGYLLGPGDTVEINVLSVPDLSRTQAIGPDGTVQIPYSGQVPAIGRTVTEVQNALILAMSNELLDPEVEVIAVEYGSQRIFVGGEVELPSTYELPGPIDPLQAIILAGGFTDQARRDEVILLRREPNGQVRSAKVNIRRGVFNAQYADWGPLQRFDIVYVPKSRIAAQNLFVQQWFRDALPVAFSLVYDLNNATN